MRKYGQVSAHNIATDCSAPSLTGLSILCVPQHSLYILPHLPSASIGGIPYDGVPEEQDVPISVGLTVVVSLLGTAGILFSLACLAFNFHFRNKM